MKKEFKYEEAVGEIKLIVKRMESNELDIDTLGEQLRRAQELITKCKDRLTKTDEEIRKILDKE